MGKINSEYLTAMFIRQIQETMDEIFFGGGGRKLCLTVTINYYHSAAESLSALVGEPGIWDVSAGIQVTFLKETKAKTTISRLQLCKSDKSFSVIGGRRSDCSRQLFRDNSTFYRLLLSAV